MSSSMSESRTSYISICLLKLFFINYYSSQLFTQIPRWEVLSKESRKLHHGDREMYEETARKGGKTLFFARSAQEDETWV